MKTVEDLGLVTGVLAPQNTLEKYNIAKEVISLCFDEVVATKYILVGIDKLLQQIFS